GEARSDRGGAIGEEFSREWTREISEYEDEQDEVDRKEEQ
ncbi:MAG: hypothetical protein QOK03_2467, partial [Candidatus Binataceae bacterium]|nr:hypothetical protein [Candidatus Binataceae bacterium]